MISHPAVYKLCKKNTKFNICGIETSRYRNKEIEGFKERVDQAITPVLMYASQYWAEHLEYGSAPKEGSHPLGDTVRDFFTCRLLYWIEVFSAKDRMYMLPRILRKATGWAKVCFFLFRAGQ